MNSPARLSLMILIMSITGACSNGHAPITSVYGNSHSSGSLPQSFHSLKTNGYICQNASRYRGSYLGNGECVDLVKICSNAPHTRYWKKGAPVFGNDIPPGMAIATFRRGKYPNKSGHHAAIYSHQNKDGIFVWDQWKGQKIHLRFIKAYQSHKKPGNNASRYRVIER